MRLGIRFINPNDGTDVDLKDERVTADTTAENPERVATLRDGLGIPPIHPSEPDCRAGLKVGRWPLSGAAKGQLSLGSRAASVSVVSVLSSTTAPFHTLRICMMFPSASRTIPLMPRLAALPGLSHSKPPAVADPSTRRTPTPAP